MGMGFARSNLASSGEPHPCFTWLL